MLVRAPMHSYKIDLNEWKELNAELSIRKTIILKTGGQRTDRSSNRVLEGAAYGPGIVKKHLSIAIWGRRTVEVYYKQYAYSHGNTDLLQDWGTHTLI